MFDPNSTLSNNMKELEEETRKNTIDEFNNFKLNTPSVLEISSKGRDILFSELTNTVVNSTNEKSVLFNENTINMFYENTNVMNNEKQGGTKKKRGRK